MTETTRVIRFGLGPIGCATARPIGERDMLVLVDRVDVDRRGSTRTPMTRTGRSG
jgi:hypothetical protein